MISLLDNIKNRIFSGDANARALQMSGFIRFSVLIIQGIVLVKCGLNPFFIAIVESFYFLFNVSRFHLLSGGKYAGYAKMKNSPAIFNTVFWGFNLLGLVAATIGVLVVFMGALDFDSFLSLEYALYGLPILLFLSMPVDTYDIFYIERKRPKAVVRYTLINSLIQAAGVIYLLTHGFHMGHVVVFFVGLYLLRYIHLILVSGSLKRIEFRPAWVFVLFAFPLILHSLFSGLTDYVDGFLIKSFFEEADFAKYRYGARELPLNAILIGAVVSGLLIRATAVEQVMKKEISKIMKLLTPILAVLMIVSPWLFQYFYSTDYKVSALYFNLYALLIISHAVFVQVFFYRENDRWLLTLLSFIEVVCNVALSMFLMSKLGILGIPIATLIVDFIFRIVFVFMVKQLYGQGLREYYPIKTHLICSSILLAAFSISYVIHF